MSFSKGLQMDCYTEDITIKMEPPLEISDSESESESGSETHAVKQNSIGNIPKTFQSPGMVIGTTTYSNTSLNINMEKEPTVFSNASGAESTFVGRESRGNLTWEQTRFIDFMSSHILQLSLPLQNEFLDGVMGLYLEISKRNH